ncbi:MAG: cell surface protein [Myxococcales bacterium]|nr:MAG: cell surface protein [Myxococcales bacterium]
MVEGHSLTSLGCALLLTLVVGCSAEDGAPAPMGAGGDAAGGDAAGGAPTAPAPSGALYASSVESFTPGDGAGYNAEELPDIVLGAPRGGGQLKGSLDVLSLGAGGEIVLGFGDHGFVDGPGADLVVFENPFWPEGDASQVFAELGEVAVSEDGRTWRSFECDTDGDDEGRFPGCAGFTPTLQYDAEALVPLDPEKSGGDAFDLADVGLSHARFVRIRDLETLAPGGTASGFDLDAVGVIHPD